MSTLAYLIATDPARGQLWALESGEAAWAKGSKAIGEAGVGDCWRFTKGRSPERIAQGLPETLRRLDAAIYGRQLELAERLVKQAQTELLQCGRWREAMAEAYVKGWPLPAEVKRSLGELLYGVRCL